MAGDGVDAASDYSQELHTVYRRLAEVAEQLAASEADAAAIFESLARLGGRRAEHRLALGEAATRQVLALEEWSARLRSRDPT